LIIAKRRLMSGKTIHLRCNLARPWAIAITVAIAACGCGKGKTSTSQANDLFLQAKQFLAAGEKAKALDALNKSIETEPALWSYHERAKLHAELDDSKSALADCEAALKLDPNDPDATWLKTEIAKPAAERFKGKLKSPPSRSR